MLCYKYNQLSFLTATSDQWNHHIGIPYCCLGNIINNEWATCIHYACMLITKLCPSTIIAKYIATVSRKIVVCTILFWYCLFNNLIIHYTIEYSLRNLHLILIKVLILLTVVRIYCKQNWQLSKIFLRPKHGATVATFASTFSSLPKVRNLS